MHKVKVSIMFSAQQHLHVWMHCDQHLDGYTSKVFLNDVSHF